MSFQSASSYRERTRNDRPRPFKGWVLGCINEAIDEAINEAIIHPIWLKKGFHQRFGIQPGRRQGHYQTINRVQDQMVVRPYRQYQSISNVHGKKANADDGDDDNGCRSKTQPKAKGGAKKTICSKKGSATKKKTSPSGS